MSFDLERRLPPPGPYRPKGRVLVLTRMVLEATASVLRGVGHNEACCLWLGNRDESGTERVAAVVIPKQTNRRLNYFVETMAMMEVSATAKRGGWTLIANVHSHPGANVEHSTYDDEMMPSRKALSIVVPYHGRYAVDRWPDGVGLHEFVGQYWHLLTLDKASERAVIDDTATTNAEVVDLR